MNDEREVVDRLGWCMDAEQAAFAERHHLRRVRYDGPPITSDGAPLLTPGDECFVTAALLKSEPDTVLGLWRLIDGANDVTIGTDASRWIAYHITDDELATTLPYFTVLDDTPDVAMLREAVRRVSWMGA